MAESHAFFKNEDPDKKSKESEKKTKIEDTDLAIATKPMMDFYDIEYKKIQPVFDKMNETLSSIEWASARWEEAKHTLEEANKYLFQIEAFYRKIRDFKKNVLGITTRSCLDIDYERLIMCIKNYWDCTTLKTTPEVYKALGVLSELETNLNKMIMLRKESHILDIHEQLQDHHQKKPRKSTVSLSQ